MMYAHITYAACYTRSHNTHPIHTQTNKRKAKIIVVTVMLHTQQHHCSPSLPIHPHPHPQATELFDYGDDVQQTNTATAKKEKGSHVSVHSATFKEFVLRDELQRAITDCGFEHPSEGASLHSRLYT